MMMIISNEAILFFFAGLAYAGIYDLVKTKLSVLAIVLMGTGITVLFLTENINIDALTIGMVMIFGILTFPLMITYMLKKVHIYFWDCLVVALLVLINVNRLIVFTYYLIFLPLAFIVYLVAIRRKKNLLANNNNEVPFLFVLFIAVIMAEVFLYLYSTLLPSI